MAAFDPITVLRREHSRAQTDKVAAWVGDDPAKFAEIVALMTGSDRLLAQRSAWVVAVVGEAHPEWVGSHLAAMLDHLSKPGLHPAVVRAVFRLMQTAPIPGNLEGRVMAVAFAALGGVAAAAVKAYSLTVLRRLAEAHPGILGEVRALLAEQLPTACPAVRSRARREFGVGRQGPERRWEGR
ncbi:MAG: hypothetical protein J0M04_01355 [Verrucomicrobia bacterium]|nr:hypothetical protein [Verrucomicrobiota bacterium]